MNYRLRKTPHDPGRRILGTLARNLDAAVISAVRLRHQKVYSATLVHWRELVELARQSLPADALAMRHPIALAADRLERELNDRAGEA
jgi:hypothetical protein